MKLNFKNSIKLTYKHLDTQPKSSYPMKTQSSRFKYKFSLDYFRDQLDKFMVDELE